MCAPSPKTESRYLQDPPKEMPFVDQEIYFTIDEKQHSIEMTEKGLDLISGDVDDPQFFILTDVGGAVAEIEKSNASVEEKAKRKDEVLRDFGSRANASTVNQLIRAYALYDKDVGRGDERQGDDAWTSRPGASWKAAATATGCIRRSRARKR
ncbi:MAG: hypothetical protein IPO60_18055 [Flavobacteriales bacterium]|nr:hypothetical protein [Flavobacteriales bacterium]